MKFKLFLFFALFTLAYYKSCANGIQIKLKLSIQAKRIIDTNLSPRIGRITYFQTVYPGSIVKGTYSSIDSSYNFTYDKSILLASQSVLLFNYNHLSFSINLIGMDSDCDSTKIRKINIYIEDIKKIRYKPDIFWFYSYSMITDDGIVKCKNGNGVMPINFYGWGFCKSISSSVKDK